MADRVDHRKHVFVESHDLSVLQGKTIEYVAEFMMDGDEERKRSSFAIRFTDKTELLLICCRSDRPDVLHGLQLEIHDGPFLWHPRNDERTFEQTEVESERETKP